MTDFTKGILKREIHTFAGILCGGAIVNAIERKDEKDNGFYSYVSTLAEVVSVAVIGYYVLNQKSNTNKIRFVAGLLASGACHYLRCPILKTQ